MNILEYNTDYYYNKYRIQYEFQVFSGFQTYLLTNLEYCKFNIYI